MKSTPPACGRPSSTRTRTSTAKITATSCALPAATRKDRTNWGTSSTRIPGFRVDEVPQFVLSFRVAAGNAHDVAVIFAVEVLVLVDEGLPHAGGVLFIHAENDGFLEAVAALLEKAGDLLGDQFGAVVDHQDAVVVFGVVKAVFDLVALAVGFALLGAVAFHVHVNVDLDHLVGRQESVANTLLERVGVYRFAEVVDVRNVFGFLGRGGEADLGGGGEVFEDFVPGRIGVGAAAVALVDNDKVEETRGELAKEFLAVLGARDGLIEAEVNLVGGIDAALLVEREGEFLLRAVGALDGLRVGAELGHGGAEGAEVVDHGLIDQDVAVGQK